MLRRENFMRLKFSEMQSSVFWTLRFSKCLDSIMNHRCGCGQRSNFKTLYDACRGRSDCATAQPPGKDNV